MKKTLLLIPLAMAATAGLHAQSIGPATVNANGGTAVIAGNEFDWSVGEMAMVSTFTTPGIVVTQGVLQPAEQDKTAVKDHVLKQQLQVFPNPASTVVNIQYASPGEGVLSCKLLDMGGKMISRESMNTAAGSNTHQVNVASLPSATYMLEVTVNNGAAAETMSYKIQKLK